MDLINKQEALRLLKLNYDDSPTDVSYLMYNDGVRSCVKTIREMKALDVVPWRWLENYIDSFGPMLREDYKGFIKLARYKYEGV
jgi:hypothetical protein